VWESDSEGGVGGDREGTCMERVMVVEGAGVGRASDRQSRGRTRANVMA
jgi:hypothetical protein